MFENKCLPAGEAVHNYPSTEGGDENRCKLSYKLAVHSYDSFNQISVIFLAKSKGVVSSIFTYGSFHQGAAQ